MNRHSSLFFFLCSILRFPAATAFVGRSSSLPSTLVTSSSCGWALPRQRQLPARHDVRLLASQRTFSSSPSASSRQQPGKGGGGGGQQQLAELQRQKRRRVLLSRTGPHFQLNRFSGQIEFGATAKLTTKLTDSSEQQSFSTEIDTWLMDERGMAMSIWDEKLTTDLGNHVYRLQIMTLQFVTLQLSPSVDVRMKTVMEDSPTSAKQQEQPVFTLDSVNFDPNIEFLPGMKISAESLGIVIEVAGEMRALADGKGINGKISFQTSGSLPPPMRILPDAVLQAASDSINETVANFAIQSFERGARAQFRAFLKKQEQLRKEQEQKQAEER